MQIQIKNKYIYFAIHGVWQQLDYRFCTHIWELVSANSEDEFEQTVDVPMSQLLLLYNNAANQQEGIAASMNTEMNTVILSQLLPQAGMTMQDVGVLIEEILNPVQESMDHSHPVEPVLPTVMQGKEGNEAAQALYEICKVRAANIQKRDAKVASGRRVILLPYN